MRILPRLVEARTLRDVWSEDRALLRSTPSAAPDKRSKCGGVMDVIPPLHFDLSAMRKTVGQDARSSRQDAATLCFKPAAKFHFPLNQHTPSWESRPLGVGVWAQVGGEVARAENANKPPPAVRTSDAPGRELRDPLRRCLEGERHVFEQFLRLPGRIAQRRLLLRRPRTVFERTLSPTRRLNPNHRFSDLPLRLCSS